MNTYPGLSSACRETLIAHGTEQQQQQYLHKMVSGEWTGTMCLTEPQGGSDLSFLCTKAENNGDDVFYQTKVATAHFYFQKLLPRTASLKATIETGADSLMALSDEQFEQMATL